MKRVVYNAVHGGFSLSKLAAMWLAGRGHEESVVFLAGKSEDWGENFYPRTLARHSMLLVECVEVLGKKASGPFSDLKIAEVEDLYVIDEYDGLESVVQPSGMKWISAVNDPEAHGDPYGDY